MSLRFIFVLLTPLLSFAQDPLPALGGWQEHLPYSSAIDVAATANKVYVATPYSLFSINRSSDEIERLSKVSGLSETGIASVAATSEYVIIAYRNGNVDVLDQKGVHNLPDFKRKNIQGDKTVFDILPANSLSYLSTGIGILVVDPVRMEFQDNWFIGTNGAQIPCYELAIAGGFFYAATSEGLKRASVSGTDPADFHNWSPVPPLATDTCRAVVNFKDHIVALQRNQLFRENNGSWTPFFTTTDSIVSIHTTADELLVALYSRSSQSRWVSLSDNGTVLKTFATPGLTDFPKAGIRLNQEYWLADSLGGLSRWNAGAGEALHPDSPQGLLNGASVVFEGAFYGASSGTSENAVARGIGRLKEGSWTRYNGNAYPILSAIEIFSLTGDPATSSLWFTSSAGLLNLSASGTLAPATGTPFVPANGKYLLGGSTYETGTGLWVVDNNPAPALHLRDLSGAWHSYPVPAAQAVTRLGDVTLDGYGNKWAIAPNQGLLVFNSGASTSTADDRWRLFRSGTGQGNLPSNQVLSIASDRNDFIWVGTADGIGIVQCSQDVFSNCDAVLPVITEDNFANYLFKGQVVRSIAVDGANRKWVATETGAWLVAPDGDRILSHFTAENSPLLDNNVLRIAIDPATGIVYFSTSKGIVSYRGTATGAGSGGTNVLVYPNPVPPAYQGMIGIRGLPDNSRVKIIEPGGRLVYEGRSLGSQFVWNGKDYRGRPISSGTYLVMAIDDKHQEKKVSTIVFIGN